MKRMLPLALAVGLVSPSPAAAWEFRVTDMCEIAHAGPEGEVSVVFDPGTRLYGITVTTPAAWPDAPVFSVAFGQTGLTISTNRHVLSQGGRALTVTDTGFGNVLLGLETAGSATASAGAAAARFDLDGARDAVAEFRACTTAPTA